MHTFSVTALRVRRSRSRRTKTLVSHLRSSSSMERACVLFMVSLPLGKMEVAGRLRRMSGALMLLAFAPYVFVDLVRALAHDSPHVVVPGGSITGGGFLQLVGALAL